MKNRLKGLTTKEEEVMNHFWLCGDLFVRELLEKYDDPKPHFNTLSTVVRGLVEKGYLAHRAFGSTYQYYPIMTQEQFKAQSLKGVIGKYYQNSILSAVSALVETKEISADELRELVEMINREEERL